MRSKQFKTKYEAFQKSKKVWICKNCTLWHKTKPVTCNVCKRTEFYYLASEIEAEHFGELQLLESYGHITELETQVDYPLIVNEEKITTYRADFVYRDSDGKQIVEDVKASQHDKYLTSEFKMKCKLMKALYNIDVRVTKRR